MIKTTEKLLFLSPNELSSFLPASPVVGGWLTYSITPTRTLAPPHTYAANDDAKAKKMIRWYGWMARRIGRKETMTGRNIIQ